MIPVIAVVGGIGSGKSLVARELARQGGYLIQADELGHAALRQPEIVAEVVGRWGTQVLDEQGEVSRRKLGRIVFAATAELRHLESLVYPWIRRRIEEEKAEARQIPDVRFIVLDAAVILEAGWSDPGDHIVFVDVPRPLRLERLQASRGWDDAELTARERNQLPLEDKRRRADAVIDNSGGPEAVADQVTGWLRSWNLEPQTTH